MNSTSELLNERQPLSPLVLPSYAAKLVESTKCAKSEHCCSVIGWLPRAEQSWPPEMVTSRLPIGATGAGGVGCGADGGDAGRGLASRGTGRVGGIGSPALQ